MRFAQLRVQIKNLPIFSLNDIRNINPDFHKRQLMDWLDRDYLSSFAGEYYFLPENDLDESFLFISANRLYEPSYISLESALAYYHAIPESVLGVTSVSSRKTKQFESEWGTFSYRSVKPLYMFGYEVVESAGRWKYTIARLEKAVFGLSLFEPTHQED